MIRFMYTLLIAVGAFLAPEMVPWETIENEIVWLLGQITYDSILAWVIVLMRRFVFVSAPQYFMLWFLRPLAPRWLRRRVDAWSAYIGQQVAFCLAWLQSRTLVFRSRPFLVVLSLTFSLALFTVVYHYFGHYVVAVIGLWAFVKPYAIYSIDSFQHYTFRVVAFFNLEWLTTFLGKWLPKRTYAWIVSILHTTYRYCLRLQISWRLAVSRSVVRVRSTHTPTE